MAQTTTTKQKVAANLFWRFLERGGSQVVSFVVSLVLARILEPAEFGPVSKVLVITAILTVFVDSGMANALIQKKDPDDLDFSSVFWFNICFCLLLYSLLFLFSPLIARMYHEPDLTPILRVLGLVVVVAGVKNVQQAYVSKTLQFRRFFFATLGGTLISAVVGITMARKGFGVWALVAQQLTSVSVSTMILWLTVGWRPKRMFSLQRLIVLLKYGWKLFASQMLDTIYLKIYPLIIGIRYTNAELAFFERGNSWPNLLTENINASIDSVLLPVLSAEQDDRTRVRDMTRRAIKTSSYLMMPMMAGLAACAKPLVTLLLGEKWLPCVPFMQIYCAIYAFYPLHTANLNAIKAVGRSDVFLKLEILKKTLETAVLLVTMRFGILYMALGQLFTSVCAQVINAWPNRKLLSYSYGTQIRDMLPAILLSLTMCGCVLLIGQAGLETAVTLLLQIAAGVVIYVALSLLFRVESFTYILGFLKKRIRPGETTTG